MAQAFDSIKQGFTEAVAHAQTKGKQPVGLRVVQPQAVDVAQLGIRLALSQEKFAARFGFSVATPRHWERGDRSPSDASLVLLKVIHWKFEALQKCFMKAHQSNFYPTTNPEKNENR